MDFAKALTYPFDDDDWLAKLGIAAAIVAGGVLLGFLLLIPTIIMALVLAGWRLQIIQNVKNEVATPLPNISDDFGGFLRRGVPLLVAGIGYAAPIILLSCVLIVAQFGILGGAGALGENGGGALASLIPILSICFSCLSFIYVIVAYFVYLGGLIRFVDDEQLGTFFQIGDNIALVRENIGDFGQAILWIIVGGFIGGLLQGIPILGTFLSPVFTTYFAGHILGQLAQKLSPAAVVPAV